MQKWELILRSPKAAGHHAKRQLNHQDHFRVLMFCSRTLRHGQEQLGIEPPTLQLVVDALYLSRLNQQEKRPTNPDGHTHRHTHTHSHCS